MSEHCQRHASDPSKGEKTRTPIQQNTMFQLHNRSDNLCIVGLRLPKCRTPSGEFPIENTILFGRRQIPITWSRFPKGIITNFAVLRDIDRHNVLRRGLIFKLIPYIDVKNL